MPIDRIPSAGIESGGVAPSNLSTGAPSWDTSGNVGIGTSLPTARLQLVNSSANCGVIIDGQNATGRGAFINLKKGGTDTAYIGQASAILGGASTSNDLLLWADGSINQLFYINGTERMRIASDGPVRIAMQNYGLPPSSTNFGVSINNTSAGSRFYGQGTGTETQIEFGNTNGARGSIQTNATNTLYNTTSDYRLKENVVPMTGALDIVSTLKPCTYTWKVNGSAGQGFIAHELQAVIPDAVTGEKDAVDDKGDPKYQMVDTSFLVATLTAALQELKAEVDALRAQVEAK